MSKVERQEIWQKYADKRCFQPEWDSLWCQRVSIPLWQGVALSVGFDPEFFQLDGGNSVVLASIYKERFSRDFYNEIRTATENRCSIAQDRIEELEVIDHEWPFILNSTVGLKSLANWVVNTVRWPVPDAFAELLKIAPARDSGALASAESPLLEASQNWRDFREKIERAVTAFPGWQQSVRKVSKSKNMHDWLTETIGLNQREAEMAKKVVTDIFKLS